MQQLPTENPLRDSDHVQFIAEHLPGFENIGQIRRHSSRVLSSQAQKGQQSEDLVVQYLVGYGWRLVAKNWRSPWAEVDIVLFGKETILLTEVKAIRKAWIEDPVSRAQRGRLGLVLEELIERFPQYKIWMWLALVSDRNEVKIFRDYFGE